MAGSYNHAVEDDGMLVEPERIGIAAENLGDAYETIEEMYGMIWFLAGHHENPTMAVEQAQQHYKSGLEAARRILRSDD